MSGAPSTEPSSSGASRPPSALTTDHLHADLRSRSVRGGVVTFGAQLAKALARVVSLVVLARLLTPEDFGVFAKVLAIVTFAGLVRDMGIATAIAQRQDLTDDEATAAAWLNLGLAFGVATLVAASAPLLAIFYGDPRVTGVTLALAASTLFGGLAAMPLGVLRRQMRFGPVARSEIVAQVVSVGAALAAAVAGAGYWALVMQHIVQQFWTAASFWLRCGWRPGRFRRGLPMAWAFRFGAHMTGAMFLNTVARQLDQILVAKIYGSATLGHYSRAFALVLLPQQQIVIPLGGVGVPMLSRLADQPARFANAAASSVRLVVLMTAPLAAFMVATAPWLVRVALGPQWDQAAVYFAILGAIAIAQPFCMVTDWILLSASASGEMFRCHALASGAQVAAIAATVAFGPVALAIGVAASFVLVRAPIQCVWTGRHTPISAGALVRAAGPGLALAAGVAAAAVGVRLVFSDISAPVGLLACVGASGGASVMIMLALPTVRAHLRESVGLLMTAISRRRTNAGATSAGGNP